MCAASPLRPFVAVYRTSDAARDCAALLSTFAFTTQARSCQLALYARLARRVSSRYVPYG
jgi:hypothetical protein